jgi:hypothetical protein
MLLSKRGEERASAPSRVKASKAALKSSLFLTFSTSDCPGGP